MVSVNAQRARTTARSAEYSVRRLITICTHWVREGMSKHDKRYFSTTHAFRACTMGTRTNNVLPATQKVRFESKLATACPATLLLSSRDCNVERYTRIKSSSSAHTLARAPEKACPAMSLAAQVVPLVCCRVHPAGKGIYAQCVPMTIMRPKIHVKRAKRRDLVTRLPRQ